jgi:hypothetical protein
MCAIFQSLSVRKLIAKPRIPQHRGLRVRGSSHPYFERDYEPFLPPYAAASKPFRTHFRIHSDLPRRDGMEAYARRSRSPHFAWQGFTFTTFYVARIRQEGLNRTHREQRVYSLLTPRPPVQRLFICVNLRAKSLFPSWRLRAFARKSLSYP